jgi:hypothetical protein
VSPGAVWCPAVAGLRQEDAGTGSACCVIEKSWAYRRHIWFCSRSAPHAPRLQQVLTSGACGGCKAWTCDGGGENDNDDTNIMAGAIRGTSLSIRRAPPSDLQNVFDLHTRLAAHLVRRLLQLRLGGQPLLVSRLLAHHPPALRRSSQPCRRRVAVQSATSLSSPKQTHNRSVAWALGRLFQLHPSCCASQGLHTGGVAGFLCHLHPFSRGRRGSLQGRAGPGRGKRNHPCTAPDSGSMPYVHPHDALLLCLR